MDMRSQQLQSSRAIGETMPAPPKLGVGQTLLESLELLYSAHQRLDSIEDRMLGGQPRKGDVPTAPTSVTDAAMRVRSEVITLNDRLEKLSGLI